MLIASKRQFTSFIQLESQDSVFSKKVEPEIVQFTSYENLLRVNPERHN